MLYGVIFGAIVFFVIIILIAKNSDAIFHKLSNDEIGANGENFVAGILNEICEDSVIFNDILFKDKNGKLTQIDHIVIRSNGIFVIETKNYAGRIYGKDE
ncbi:MAG: NERD domain-containing protein [Clostridiales bacterium]|jgi:hypothetical protein|nr:NERD domain-containing protein [Clostridiales bacterium]